MGFFIISGIIVIASQLIILSIIFYKNITLKNKGLKNNNLLIFLPPIAIIWFIFIVYIGIDLANYIRRDIYDIVGIWRYADSITGIAVATLSIFPTMIINVLTDRHADKRMQ